MDPVAESPIEIAVAVFTAAFIAAIALRQRHLDRTGAVAATLLGPALVATGGWWLGAILIAFFLSSTMLPGPASERPARTWRQVLANGGPALGFGVLAHVGATNALLVAAAATLAATTSDTWATELGRRFGGIPYSLRTGKRVAPGMSGAISVAGTAASAAGAVFIALLTVMLGSLAPVEGLGSLETTSVVTVTGILGSTIDSLLGATVQARFACARCGAVTEFPNEHLPGHPMIHRHGIRWMTNSAVNLAAALAAGILATLLALTIG